MSDYIKITWTSPCTYDDIYYNDGYSDFLFILAKDADIVEPIYELVRNDTQEKDGRPMSPDKLSRKTYKLKFRATESLCDTLNTIPLASTVKIQFPDDSLVSLTGDDVSVNFEESSYSKDDQINTLMASLLFLTNVTIKKECCLPDDVLLPNTTVPTITYSEVIGNTVLLNGTAPTNYFVKGFFREFWQTTANTSGITGVKKITMYSAIAGFFISSNNKIYKTTDGFLTASLKHTPGEILNAIDCIDSNHVIAVGNAGNLYVSSDGGTTWSNKVTGDINNLYNIKIKDTLNVAFCGANGSLYLSNNFLLSNLKQTTGIAMALRGLDYCNYLSSDVWIAMGDLGTILTMSIIDYTIDNNPTLTGFSTVNYTGIKFVGNIPYAITSNGDVVRMDVLGGSWHVITTGTYTNFTDLCVTKYGLLCVGVEDIVISATDVITLIKDDNTTARLGCSCFNSLLPYASINTINVLNGNNSFTQNGILQSTNFGDDSLTVTFPVTGRTYVVKVQAFIQQYDGSYSAEILVVT